MNYPLQLTFKTIALAPQISVRDANGNQICYIKQQLFKLKERVRVFTDASMTTVLAEINADKIIDFSATYSFTDANGNKFGAVRRRGMRSLWRTHYEITQGGQHVQTIREGNPWTKVVDGFFSEIPLLGIFSGYVFHPYYDVLDLQGNRLLTLHKRPAFLEGKFELVKHTDVENDITVLLAVLMMTLLERRRG